MPSPTELRSEGWAFESFWWQVRLLTPLQLLLGALPVASLLSDRGPYDCPEFTPLLRVPAQGQGQQGQHTLGYWRDEPSDAPLLIVLQKPLPQKSGPGVIFTPVADNLLGALHSILIRADGLRASESKRAAAALAAAAAAAGLRTEAEGDKTAAFVARKRFVVGKTSHGMGVVVPYDQESELGYRKLYESAALRKMLANVADATGSTRKRQSAKRDSNPTPYIIDVSAEAAPHDSAPHACPWARHA